ncbi:MAG: nickel pincer cofactor biosynthesis protein LarB [Acidobacteria bacterium]|nr:MAG: nickel pincer cofactor biosynthesis protein LarB [Acidobacteriota bacterium]
MKPSDIEGLLKAVRDGLVSPDDAHARLAGVATEDLGFATIDHARQMRTGWPEVVFGGGKAPEQVAAIAEKIAGRGHNVLVTRTSAEAHRLVAARLPGAAFHESARCITVEVSPVPALPGRVAVVCAGTSDVPVADEAALTASFQGARVDRIYDVGVAGIHRLLARAAELLEADVVVVVAGMEGALPSVVAGLLAAPVIAVPTSVGYGASFQGLSALLAMLNSCAAGLAVVNIDNGFGAGHLACTILRSAARLGARGTQAAYPAQNPAETEKTRR